MGIARQVDFRQHQIGQADGRTAYQRLVEQHASQKKRHHDDQHQAFVGQCLAVVIHQYDNGGGGDADESDNGETDDGKVTPPLLLERQPQHDHQ